jgi:hypothetical protein
MIELDVYYFHWLGSVTCALESIPPGAPIVACLERMIFARMALEGFTGDVARAFPLSADSASELLVAINALIPPVGSPIPNLDAPIQQYQTVRLRALVQSLAASLRDEGKRSYVLKIQDQRCFSSHTLVEKIENCFPSDAWAVMVDDAKRELEEAGRCLSFERFTAAGFHALRGVECVIRQYIKKLTGAELDNKKRDWGFYIKTLADNGADAKLIAVLDNIRTLDRNPLMHPEDSLDIDEAVGIFNISQTAIVRLVAGIQEVR